MRRWSHATVVIALLGLAGCGDDMGFERLRPNLPPETSLSSGPPDSVDGTHYRVRFTWSGSDRDGSIDHFDLILIDHPPVQSHIDGDPGDDDRTRVMVEVPAVDDRRWVGTRALDSVFVTLADTLRRPPWPDPGENPDDVRRTPYERWHTLFVRAVDDRGLPDPTPDYRSFNSTNIAPLVHLREPVRAGEPFHCPPVVVFSWEGEDPVDESNSTCPVASRFVTIASKIDIHRPGNAYTSFPDSLYVLPARYQWSAWARWGNGGDGRRAVVSGLERVGDAPGVGYYIFAVQAMDEAGAITPVFDWTTPGKNNVALLRVSGNVGPLLSVREPTLGSQSFVAGSRAVRFNVPAGLPLRFSWQADASRYGGTIVAYRYAWDLRDRSDDREWEHDWSPTATSSPGRAFADGTHRFYVQARDDAGIVSDAVYELAVHAVKRSRALLWVDDTDHQTDTATEALEDARWPDVLARVAGAHGFAFDPNQDVFDIATNRREPPPFALLLDHGTVVWSVRGGASGSSCLLRVAQFCSPYTGCNPFTRSPERPRPQNDLLSYIESGGKLWINGFQPARQLWTDIRAHGREHDAVNVTNWRDPLYSGLQMDSLGVTSLLYRMGIEMFDSNLGVGDRPQTCLGFRPGSLPGTPVLEVSAAWPQGGAPGRAAIEIYNMPAALAAQQPPLVPRQGLAAVLYTFVSSLPADPAGGFVYPSTADGQPALILARASPTEPSFSRAFCGFEPYLLTADSHLRLAEYVLVEQFRLADSGVAGP